MVELPTPGHKESAKPRPLGQKSHAKTPPRAKSSTKKHTKHETVIMKNSTEMLICLEILRLLFVLATEHTLLSMFLNINFGAKFCFRETCMVLLFRMSVQLIVEPLTAHAVCNSQHA